MSQLKLVERTAETQLDTEYGKFRFLVYRERKTGKEHIVLVKPWRPPSPLAREDRATTPLVRIHSECATGDIFASEFCDCGPQLHEALKRIQKEGGILIYLKQEGRGLGLTEKIKAYELQRKGMDTVEANLVLGHLADERNYDIPVEMLNCIGVKKLRLLTNNPDKIKALEDAGFEVERVPLILALKTQRGKKYLKVKQKKLGHLG